MPASGRTLIDLSHAIEHGLVTYPGLPAPVISDHLSREESRTRYTPPTEFQIGRIDMVANTGTYVDAPFHRFVKGVDVARLPLSSLADLPGVVVRAASKRERAIDADAFAGIGAAGKAVLIHTGWDVHFGTPRYFEGHPFLTEEAALLLARTGAALVGIDSLNIDDTNDGRRPVHTILLRAGIPIAEHLTNLGQVPDLDFRFFAVPARVRGLGSFPVRAFCIAGARCRKPRLHGR